jgi:hypothetical protein
MKKSKKKCACELQGLEGGIQANAETLGLVGGAMGGAALAGPLGAALGALAGLWLGRR